MSLLFEKLEFLLRETFIWLTIFIFKIGFEGIFLFVLLFLILFYYTYLNPLLDSDSSNRNISFYTFYKFFKS
jgi:hypothetical protein